MSCPVCKNEQSILFDSDKYRSYYKCSECALVYVPREMILSPEAELSRYECHQNQESDTNYRQYLSEIVSGVLPYVNLGIGLDFGCGKTKLLARIFQEQGLEVDSYDLYFYPYENIWEKKYDFIILSEVIEHLRDPLETMTKLRQLLSHEGKIVVKTKFYPQDSNDFSKWFYKRDLTHVQFFNSDSMTYLGHKIGLEHFVFLDLQDLYLLDHHGV